MEKSIFKDVLVGLFEFDFSYIYNMENRTMRHQWVGLNNPDGEDFSEVAAFMKLSASIHGPGDKPEELKEDPNPDNPNMLMPAAMKPKFKQLKLHIIKGEHLPKLDVSKGSMDAYCKTQIGKKILKTETHTTITNTDKKQKDEVTWNQTMWIPVREPMISKELIVKVMDKDDLVDDCAGSLVFDL